MLYALIVEYLKLSNSSISKIVLESYKKY